MEEMEGSRKRIKQTMEEIENQIEAVDGAEHTVVGSEEMENLINGILERIERFTQLVSELLESGKRTFKDLSSEFEDRLITIHKEQIEKWQEEIKELRSLDASNEEANAVLLNARFLLKNVEIN